MSLAASETEAEQAALKAAVPVPRLARRQSAKQGWLSRSSSRWIVIGTALTVLSIAAAAALQLRRDHTAALEHAEAQSREAASLSAGFLGADFDRMRLTAEAVGRDPAMAGTVMLDPAVADIIVTNDSGQVLHDKSGANPGRVLGDMGLIRELLKSPSLSIATGRIADPAMPGAPLGIAMRNGQSNEFTILAIKPEHLSQRLSTIAKSRDDHFLLADMRGRLLAYSANAPRWTLEALDALPPIGGRSAAITRYADAGGGIQAMASAAVLPGYDLMLVVVARAADRLSGWYDSLPLYAVMLFGPSLLGAALAWALLEQIERRRRADSALRRTEERFELAIAGARCGIWDWDIRQSRMYWSAAMLQLLGLGRRARVLSREEIAGIIHPDDLYAFERIEAAIQSGETHYDQVLRLRHTSGAYVWVRAKGQLFSGIIAQYDRLVGIAIDVSDQVSIEESRKAAEQRLRAAIESVAESFVLWDPQDRLVLSNRRFQEFYGISRAEPGETKGQIWARANTPGMTAQESALIDTGHSSDPSATVELQRAGARWLLVSEKRMADGGRVSVATDISALKAQEDELVRREIDLQATVGELEASRGALQDQTSALADLAHRLEAEKQKAEAANRAKSEFLANMSHELRTPLNAILGFSDVMRNTVFGPLPEKYAEYASDIHRSGQHLLDLINDVLDMAKIEAGRLELDRAPIDVRAMIADAIRVVAPHAQEASLLIANAVNDCGAVYADRRALKQVLLNLLSNAIKFTPPGGQVSVACENDAGVTRFIIRDTGIGIAAEDIPRVVKPFERSMIGNSGGRRGGTGLGLAVAKALIEMHGGNISIASERGAGTEVSFTMPRAA